MIKKSFCYGFIFAIAYPLYIQNEKEPFRRVNRVVNNTISQLRKKNDIPGMAIAVIYKGKTRYFSYGVIDIERKLPVTQHSLFEIGALSKTFTGVLGGETLARGEIKLNDSARQYWPELGKKPWQQISLLQLATYTAGGLPADIPGSVTSPHALLDFYNRWQPTWLPGTTRYYGNASMGLFGTLVVRASGMDFEQALNARVLQPLKMSHTWFTVPAESLDSYAWGYRHQQPIRLSPGILASPTYGLKSTIEDMATWAQANMAAQHVHSLTLQQGIESAQSRYWRIGGMYQGLGWDIFNWPADCNLVIYCSLQHMTHEARLSVAINPPVAPVKASWVHKTGSTAGFAAYIAFIPEKQIGIVLLANKNYPNADRIKTAYTILCALN